MKYCHKVVVLYNFKFFVIRKFSLLFLNFEVVGGIGLRTGLLIGQLTTVVSFRHPNPNPVFRLARKTIRYPLIVN